MQPHQFNLLPPSLPAGGKSGMGRKTFERFFLKTFDNGLFFPTDQSFAVPAAGGDGGEGKEGFD